jgi:hypothetical protein
MPVTDPGGLVDSSGARSDDQQSMTYDRHVISFLVCLPEAVCE